MLDSCNQQGVDTHLNSLLNDEEQVESGLTEMGSSSDDERMEMELIGMAIRIDRQGWSGDVQAMQ